jgi:formylglycine-generating enzyme required for sulfatase activity
LLEGKVVLDTPDLPSFDALRNYLIQVSNDNAPNIVHFDGHGAFGKLCALCNKFHSNIRHNICLHCNNPLDFEPQGYLLFDDPKYKFAYISSKEFASCLNTANQFRSFKDSQNGIRVVVLSACKSAISFMGQSIFNGFAQKLIQHDIPAIIAMQYTIREDAAARFSQSFYRALCENIPLTVAVNIGSQAIGVEGDQWYRPVLYLRWLDNNGGEIFSVDDGSRSKLKILQNDNLLHEKCTFPSANLSADAINITKTDGYCFSEQIDDATPLTMVLIDGGEFKMGSVSGNISEKPIHSVKIKSFYMSQFLITQRQWKSISKSFSLGLDLNLVTPQFEGDNLPMENISYVEALEFCKYLSIRTKKVYRLPSEAEWEYACRGGESTDFHFGLSISPKIVNCFFGSSNSTQRNSRLLQTTPVGSYGVSNSFGLYDMHGNVLEWCEDSWHDNYIGAPEDGEAWRQEKDLNCHVARGGCFEMIPNLCRAASRHKRRSNESRHIGLRVVCALNPE